jgi:hypothetical protein
VHAIGVQCGLARAECLARCAPVPELVAFEIGHKQIRKIRGDGQEDPTEKKQTYGGEEKQSHKIEHGESRLVEDSISGRKTTFSISSKPISVIPFILLAQGNLQFL